MCFDESNTIDGINIFKYVLTQNMGRTAGLGHSHQGNAQVTLGKVLST